MKKPLFIAIEGGEGSGKSTLVTYLKAELDKSVLITREPGGSEYAEVIRDAALKHQLAKDAIAETMICLMFAARHDHVAKTVVPTLKKGTHVITDRFDASSYAYQIYAQEGKHIEKLFWELRSSVARLPDLYIYVDVEVEEGLRRARKRNTNTTDGNHFDDRDVSFHTRLRKGYKTFLKKVPHIVIDANRPLDEVKKSFIETVKKVIHKH